MFNIQISGKTAIQFYLMAKGIQNIPVDVLILVWQDIHAKEDDKLIIEFTKLKKQAYANKLHIKEDMINKYLKRLVDNDFITPIEGFRGAYTYKPNAELDYIMCNILDNSFIMTITSNNDYPTFCNCNADYNDSGILEYNDSEKRFIMVFADGRQAVYLYGGYKLEVKVNNKWYVTEMQFNFKSKKWILKKPNNDFESWPEKLEGLEVRSIEK